MTETKDQRLPGRLPRHAPAGVAAFSAVFPLVQAAMIAAGVPAGGGSLVAGLWALAATALLLPLHVRHVYCAARGSSLRGGPWTLLALAVLVVGALPLAGGLWLPTFHVLVVSALVVLRAPWSLAAAATAVVAPVPLGLALGSGAFLVAWYVIAVVWRASALFALVWLVGATRRLLAARTALADRAVEQERMRIDGEVRRTLGDALETIVARGRRAPALVGRDSSTLADEVAAMVARARQTLADSRRLVRGYHSTSVRPELDTAMSLLAAAGVGARVVVDGQLPDALDASARTQLRSATAQLLADPSTHDRVVAVTHENGGVRIRLRPAHAASPGGGA